MAEKQPAIIQEGNFCYHFLCKIWSFSAIQFLNKLFVYDISLFVDYFIAYLRIIFIFQFSNLRRTLFVTGQATVVDDIPLTSLEESLLSLEKLDRASPEIWPEQSKIWHEIPLIFCVNMFVFILLKYFDIDILINTVFVLSSWQPASCEISPVIVFNRILFF